MKLAAVIVMVAMVAASAQGKSDSARRITVYVEDKADVPFFIKTQAQRQASHMFAAIGVTLLWKDGRPSPSETDAIAIELAAKTPRTLAPGALAYALPYEGVHIRIFWDRIQTDPAPQAVLAHVMVHETTHILQGVARHSSEGIMKAYWTTDDRAAMRSKPLTFTAEDVNMIYTGMDARAGLTTTAAAAEVAAR